MIGIEDKIFLPFLLDPLTGRVVSKEPSTGMIRYDNIKNIDVYDASGMPGGWMSSSLSFDRNTKYWGLNRSYSDPMLFVKEKADIIRELYYAGNGIETQLDLLILKYNSQPQAGEPTFVLYCRMALDFSTLIDTPDQGVQMNLIQTGLPQLLKAFENTKFAFPCDGSIPENIKVELDGLLVENISTYQVIRSSGFSSAPFIIPTYLFGNDGDSFGAIIASTDYEEVGLPTSVHQWTQQAFWASKLNNYSVKVALPTIITITGNISVFIGSGLGFNNFGVYAVTSSTYFTILDFDKTELFKIGSTYNFPVNITVTLKANENLFLMAQFGFEAGGNVIDTSGLKLSFSSAAVATRAWGITAWDLWKLLVQRIIEVSNTTNQIYNYQADSQLLQDNLNLIITSGDALRASGDPNYQKFFRSFESDSTIGGATIITAFGPVIETTPYEYFQFCNVVLFAALGNQQLPGEGESLFLEVMGYILNKDANQMDVGEMSNLKISFPDQFKYTEIEIGYPKQTYDQKAGKYEYNTTATWYTPFKSMPSKKLSLICPYRADSYGIERLRANIDTTSTTKNDSDKSIFILNADRSQYIYDFQTAIFNSIVRDIRNGSNTNIRLIANQGFQSLNTNTGQGSFFEVNNDPSIFILSYPGLSTSMPVKFTYTGQFTGNPFDTLTDTPADTVIINFYINGVKVYTRTWTSTGVDITITDTYTVTRLCVEGDTFYATVQTSIAASVDLSASYDIGTSGGYIHADNGGAITIPAGSPNAMLSMPNVTATPVGGHFVVSYGFQYFLFNNILANSSFSASLNVGAVMDNQNAGQQLKYYLYKNGVVIAQTSFAGTGGYSYPVWDENITDNMVMQLGDFFFIVATVQNINTQITGLSITFTSLSIKAYFLKRVQYDNLTGIPNIAIDQRAGSPTFGQVRTDVAGAPYNIEDLTPRRLLEKWSALPRSIWGNQVHASLIFSTLTKNQYLSTTYNGKTYKENGPYYPIGEMNPPLFLPYKLEFDTAVPISFAKLLTNAANAHINSTYNGVNIGSFPWSVKQQPALNEKQKWECMGSTATNPEDFIDLNITGLNYLIMATASIWPGFTNSMQFVPQNQTLDPRYRTLDFNSTLFCQQIDRWLNQNNYGNPWQIGEKIPLQFITNGLTPVVAQVYQLGTNKAIGDQITFTDVTNKTNAIQSPMLVFEGKIDLTGFTADNYYVIVNAGGDVGAFIISEPITVKPICYNTILLEYSNSYNRQTAIFDTGWVGALRVLGMIDNEMQPKYAAANYIDQTQDITKLGAIPFETRALLIGGDDGVPDYVIKKISRILLFDNVMIDGIGYTLDEGAEWERVFWKGNPKKYWKTTIRPSKNIDGIAVGASGIEDATVIISLDTNLFGPNGQNNSTAEPVITNLEITP